MRLYLRGHAVIYADNLAAGRLCGAAVEHVRVCGPVAEVVRVPVDVKKGGSVSTGREESRGGRQQGGGRGEKGTQRDTWEELT